MAQTKVKLISDGVIDVGHLASGHGITTDNIGEGSNLYYTDDRVSTYLSTNNYATEGYVTTAVSNLVAAAPSTLDTLNELAAALGDDPNFATTVTNSIATKLPLAGGTLTGNLSLQTSDDTRLSLSDTTDSSSITVRADFTNSIYSNKSLNIYTENADHISFSTNGQSSEKVRIESNGNVQLQTVNAQLRFQNSVGPAPFIANAGSGDQDLYISTGGSESMRINNGGQVKITRNNSSTAAGDAHLILENVSGSQSMFDFTFQDIRKASIRSDINGNLVLNSNARNFYFNNDFPAAGEVHLINRDTTFLTARSDGSVGLNDTSPTVAKLSVVSSDSNVPTLRISNQSDGGTNFVFQRWAYIRTTDAYKLDLTQEVSAGLVKYRFDLTNNSSTYNANLVLDRGNVGVSISDPTSRLDVNCPPSTITDIGETFNGAINLRIGNTVGRIGQINFSNDAAPNYAYGGIGMVMTSGSGVGLGDMIFYTKATGSDANSIERMRINSSGFIGIKNTTTDFRFQVGDVLGGASLKYLDGTSKTFNNEGIAIVGSNDAANTAIDNGIFLANNSSQNGAYSPIISFAARSASTSYNHAYASIYGIKQNSGADTNWNTGDLVLAVGNGTGPQQRFVLGYSSLVLFQTQFGVSEGWYFNDSGRSQNTIDANSSGAEIFLTNNKTAGECSLMQYRTQGTIRGSIIANTSGLFINNPSDYRLKNNVSPLAGSLEKITSLNPVTYTLNNIDNPEQKVGFIAHEVAEHMPSIVKGNKDDVYTQEDIDAGVSGVNIGQPKYQSISYSSDEMITHLVGAIKELKAEVEALKQQLNG